MKKENKVIHPVERPNKKRRVGRSIGILICCIVIILLLLWAASGVHNLMHMGRTGEWAYQKEGSALPQAEESPDAEAIYAEGEEIVTSYNDAVITYDVAQEELLDWKKYYGDKTDKYMELSKSLDMLKNSKQSYAAGSEYELKGDYDKAVKAYQKVNAEDKKYQEAQERIIRIKQEVETKKKEEKDKKEKEKLEKGKVIKTDDIKATFKKASFTEIIKPDDTSGRYQYYKVRDGEKIWLDLVFDVKNRSKEPFEIGTMVSDLTLLSDEARVECVYGAYYSEGSSLKWADDTAEIEAGKAVTYHLVIELDKKQKKSKNFLQIQFKLDGQTLKLNYR